MERHCCWVRRCGGQGRRLRRWGTLLLLLMACSGEAEGPALGLADTSSNQPVASRETSSTSWHNARGEGVYGVQLHLHGSMSEGPGSMHGHNVRASSLGSTVDVLWWTDHDWRIAGHSYVTDFDFEKGLQEEQTVPRRLRRDDWQGAAPLPEWFLHPAKPLEPASLESVTQGWYLKTPAASAQSARLEVSEEQARTGKRSLRAEISAPGPNWERRVLAFEASWERTTASLASQVRIRLSLLPLRLVGDARLVLMVLLSQHPPEFQGRLDYLFSARGNQIIEGERVAPGQVLDAARPGHPYPLRRVAIDVPYREGEWNDLVLDISGDAERYGLGGADNSIVAIQLAIEARTGGKLLAYLDDFEIERNKLGEALFQEEKRMAQLLSKERGIVNHVGQEVSYGAHLNAYGPRIPLADSDSHPHGYSPAQVVQLAHEYGGIVSLNHLFGSAWTRRPLEGSPEARASFAALVDRLIAERGYGADLLEVGYRSRGHGIRAFIDLWDHLARAGVIMTGVGVSDSHDNEKGWLSRNNFITWVYAQSHSQESLIEALRAGRAYFGDPVLFSGRLEIETGSGHIMGQVAPLRPGFRTIHYRADGIRPGQVVHLIRDGKVVRRIEPQGASFAFEESLPADRAGFVRFELVQDGSPIALSNPLYFSANAPAEGTHPRAREPRGTSPP